MSEQSERQGYQPQDGVQSPPETEQLPLWINEILGTDDYAVYLHRTREEAAQSICESGFRAGLMLSATATATSREPSRAFAQFKMIHHQPNSVIILRLPRRLYRELEQNREYNDKWVADHPNSTPSAMFSDSNLKSTDLDDLLFEKFYDEKVNQIVLPRVWVAGYADQTTLKFTPNPHYMPNLPDSELEVGIDTTIE